MNNLFNKPLEEMTDEELNEEAGKVASEVEWVDEGWAMEPNPLERNYEPSDTQIEAAHQKHDAIVAELERRSHSNRR